MPPSLIGVLLGRRSKVLISAFTVSILVLVALTAAADLWWWRQRTLESAESHARIWRSSSPSTRVRRSPPATPRCGKSPSTVARRRSFSRRRGMGRHSGCRDGRPDRRWFDQRHRCGRRHPSLHHPRAARTIRSSQYVFQRLSGLSRDELVVDTPFPARSSPRRMLIPLGRRLVRDGKFDGMVIVTLTPEDHRLFFKTMEVGAEGIVWVFHPDGVLLFREPSSDDPIGEPAHGNPVFEAARGRQESGLLESRARPGRPDLPQRVQPDSDAAAHRRRVPERTRGPPGLAGAAQGLCCRLCGRRFDAALDAAAPLPSNRRQGPRRGTADRRPGA